MGVSRDRRLSAALLAVYDVMARTNDAIAPVLDQYGLTATTAYLLWVIDPDEPAPPMRTVAERAHCTPQNVTFMCRQLESRGLVNRRPSPGDQRQRVIELTPRGQHAREAIIDLISRSSPLADMDSSSLHHLIHLLSK